MTRTAATQDSALDSAERPTRWLPGLVEVAGSLLAVTAMGALLINKADTVIGFLGVAPKIVPEHVSTYRIWLAVLAFAIVVSFAATRWRRRPGSRGVYWHVLVLLAGLMSATVFHVSPASSAPTPDPAPDRSGPVCHSGGDSDECVGG